MDAQQRNLSCYQLPDCRLLWYADMEVVLLMSVHMSFSVVVDTATSTTGAALH